MENGPKSAGGHPLRGPGLGEGAGRAEKPLHCMIIVHRASSLPITYAHPLVYIVLSMRLLIIPNRSNAMKIVVILYYLENNDKNKVSMCSIQMQTL